MSKHSFHALLSAVHQDLAYFYGDQVPKLTLGETDLLVSVERKLLQEILPDMVDTMTVLRGSGRMSFTTRSSTVNGADTIALSLSLAKESVVGRRLPFDVELSRSFALRRIQATAQTHGLECNVLSSADQTVCGLELAFPGTREEQAPAKAARAETILLVEDEDFVRNVTREVLEFDGYRVLEAVDAESGIRMFHEKSSEIDLLVTDIVMPGMNGKDLATRLAAISPSLRAIFMSGYTDNAVVRQGLADPRMAYLQKPFTVDALIRKVREVLDSPRPAMAEQAS